MNNDFEFDSLIKKMAADHQPELPSPGVIWWRAQILKKQAEKERIERPLTIMRACSHSVPGRCSGSLDQPTVRSVQFSIGPADFLLCDLSCRSGDWNRLYRLDLGDHVKRQGANPVALLSIFHAHE